jgi:hypothetical protein
MQAATPSDVTAPNLAYMTAKPQETALSMDPQVIT